MKTKEQLNDEMRQRIADFVSSGKAHQEVWHRTRKQHWRSTSEGYITQDSDSPEAEEVLKNLLGIEKDQVPKINGKGPQSLTTNIPGVELVTHFPPLYGKEYGYKSGCIRSFNDKYINRLVKLGVPDISIPNRSYTLSLELVRRDYIPLKPGIPIDIGGVHNILEAMGEEDPNSPLVPLVPDAENMVEGISGEIIPKAENTTVEKKPEKRLANKINDLLKRFLG